MRSEFKDICPSMWLLSDVSKLSGTHQTWNTEAFHSVLNNFAPKMYLVLPIGMKCRIKIASLHHNENAGCPQHKNQDGKISFQD